MEDKKIYLWPNWRFGLDFWNRWRPSWRRLLSRHAKSQAAKPYTRPDERMIHTSLCSSKSSPLRQRMSSTWSRLIQSGGRHRCTTRCRKCQHWANCAHSDDEHVSRRDVGFHTRVDQRQRSFYRGWLSPIASKAQQTLKAAGAGARNSSFVLLAVAMRDRPW